MLRSCAVSLSARVFPPISTRFRRGSPSVLLTPLLPRPDTETSMARYSGFLGRRVEVHYRAGDIVLPASGTFVADSGRSIFLEQSISQRGQQKHFRWEIPYQYIARLEDKPEEKPEDEEGGSSKAKSSAASLEPQDKVSRAAGASAGTPALLPLHNRPKTA
jgi:hypothetical protein